MTRSALGRLRAALLATAVLVVAAACGGNGEGGGEAAEAERLTKEEYIAQADAVCQEAENRFDELGDAQTIEEAAALGEEAVTIGEDQLEQLRAVRPPAEDEATIEEAYDLLEQQLAVARDLVEALREEDQAAAQELIAEGERLNEEADAIAAEYGLQVCGSA
jgi:hypothetical protein